MLAAWLILRGIEAFDEGKEAEAAMAPALLTAMLRRLSPERPAATTLPRLPSDVFDGRRGKLGIATCAKNEKKSEVRALVSSAPRSLRRAQALTLFGSKHNRLLFDHRQLGMCVCRSECVSPAPSGALRGPPPLSVSRFVCCASEF